jgi:RNA-binding protein YlmH
MHVVCTVCCCMVLQAARDDPSQLPDAVAALDCRGNFMFDAATHRDFLGAILGTGVVREVVGVSGTTDRLQVCLCCWLLPDAFKC